MLDKSAVVPQALSNSALEDVSKIATAQDLATASLAGITLSKPAVLFFHFPADPSGKGTDPLAVLKSGKDLSLGIALHNAFEVRTVEVPRGKVLLGKSAPFVLVTDAKGQVLAEAGGKGVPVASSVLYATLATAAKTLGYDLKSKVTRSCSLIQGMISVETQVKAQQEAAKAAPGGSSPVVQERLATLEKKKADLASQELALWADLPSVKPEAPAASSAGG